MRYDQDKYVWVDQLGSCPTNPDQLSKNPQEPPALRVLFGDFQVAIVYYVNAPAGSGKTYAAIRHAHRLAETGQRVLVVQPSVLLIQQTIAELSSLSPPVTCQAIYGSGPHGVGTSSNVVGDIVRHSREAGSPGQVLLITHSAGPFSLLERPEDAD